jgi:hypothetical protein
MQFHKLTVNIMLAIAATIGFQSATHASNKDGFIAEQIGMKTTQAQATQAESSAENISINQSGHTFFSDPPQLIRTAASQIGTYIPSSYEFTLTVPKDAGQPLKAVKIVQDKNMETVHFDVSDSKAFIGDRLTASSEVRLASVGGEQPTNSGEVTIVFDQPVQPGSTVTVALAAQRNPGWGGVYLFGVTAYPAGGDGLGQFLGYGRISFYGNSN